MGFFPLSQGALPPPSLGLCSLSAFLHGFSDPGLQLLLLLFPITVAIIIIIILLSPSR